jgi:NTE family protein
MRKLKLGLALGAGGMKGAAHVGVMRVLADAGIKPDVIAGTSIGSLYGGLVAVGRTPHEMEQGIRDCPSRDVYDLFRGRLRIRARNRLARRFYEALAGFHIEDLDVRYAAVASDIGRREPIAITTGPIIDAIEASIAIPIIARPVLHQGRFLLDGGVYEASPIDTAHELGADVIVSVQIGRPAQLPLKLRAGATRLASLLEAVKPHRTLAGLPFSISAFSTDICEGRSAQVVLHPQVRGLDRHTAGRMVDCLEAGVAAATEALPAIHALMAGEAPVTVTEAFAAESQRLVADRGLA